MTEAIALALAAYAALTGATALTEHEVRQTALWVSGSESWADEATEVSFCESSWRTDAVGALGEWGLLQIHPIHQLPRVRGAEAQLRQAYGLWQRDGWGAWSCKP